MYGIEPLSKGEHLKALLMPQRGPVDLSRPQLVISYNCRINGNRTNCLTLLKRMCLSFQNEDVWICFIPFLEIKNETGLIYGNLFFHQFLPEKTLAVYFFLDRCAGRWSIRADERTHKTLRRSSPSLVDYLCLSELEKFIVNQLEDATTNSKRNCSCWHFR